MIVPSEEIATLKNPTHRGVAAASWAQVHRPGTGHRSISIR
jgi:hypothetical protein